MTCQRCGSTTRIQVQAVISAPEELSHQFSKRSLRRGDVQLMGVLWETADHICTDPKCGHVHSGYGNYVTRIRDERAALVVAVRALMRHGNVISPATFRDAEVLLARIGEVEEQQ